MLTFFRRIRKALADSGSAKRYVLYAIGEILLVMIGIPLALQVNNWNEWRKDRVKENEILLDIKGNMEENIEILTQAMDLLDNINTSGNIVLNALTNKLPYSDTLDSHFSRATWAGNARIEGISNAGYEQFKNAGFHLIRNDTLKTKIINHFERDLPASVSLCKREAANLSNYAEYFTRNFNRQLGLQGLEMIPFNYSEIVRDNYCINIFSDLQSHIRLRKFFVGRFKEQGQYLLHLIKDELGEPRGDGELN